MAILLSWPIVWAAFLVGLTLPTLHAAGTPVGPLHRAVAAGDLTEVKRFIADGRPVDERDAQRRTPLLLAVEGGHDAIAKVLLDAGASPNAQADNRDTPWLLAGAKGRTEMLASMLTAGPDLSIRNRFGGNALIPACERGHVDTVRLLLGTTIDVNHVNDLGWTCLLEAVILGDGGPRHQAVVRLVLQASADPNRADREGLTPLDHARRQGQETVARLIEAAGGRTGAAAPSGR